MFCFKGLIFSSCYPNQRTYLLYQLYRPPVALSHDNILYPLQLNTCSAVSSHMSSMYNFNISLFGTGDHWMTSGVLSMLAISVGPAKWYVCIWNRTCELCACNYRLAVVYKLTLV